MVKLHWLVCQITGIANMPPLHPLGAFLGKLPPFILISSGLILLFAVCMAIRVLMKARILAGRLNQFAKLFLKPGSPPNSAPTPELAARIHQTLQTENPSIEPWWAHLSRHLQVYQGRRPSEGLFLVTSSREALPESELIGRDFNADFYHSLPGIVTGLGLAITFIAILMGLYHVSYDPTKIGNPVQGIEGLINNLSGKFTSSVVALGSAIGLTLVLKRQERRVDMAYRHCLDAVSFTFPPLTEAMILADIQASGAEREKALKNITSDMVDGFKNVFIHEISPALSHGIFETLDPNLRALNATLIDLMTSVEKMEASRQESVLSDLKAALDGMHQALVQSLGSVGEDLQKSLGGAAQTEFQKIQSALAGSASLLEQMNHGFAQTQEVFGSSLKDFYSQARTQMDQWMAPLERVTQELATAGTQLREAGVHLKPLVEDIGGAIGLIRGTIASATELTDKFSGLEDRIQAHVHANAETVAALTQVQERTSGSLSHAEKIQNHAADALQGYQTTLRAAGETLGSLDQELEQAFSVIHQGLTAWTQSADGALRQFTARSNDHLSTISKSLGSQLDLLAEKLEEMNDALDRLQIGSK